MDRNRDWDGLVKGLAALAALGVLAAFLIYIFFAAGLG